MAKTIKFNMVLDGNPVRDIEGLQQNFSIEDMLGYYRSGLLKKWLQVRGFEEQLALVEAMNATEDSRIVKELIRIFEIEADEKKVDEIVSVLNYLEDERMRNEYHRDNEFRVDLILETYFTGYEKLIEHMLANPEDMAMLKADAIELERQYERLFAKDYHRVFGLLADRAPKGVFAVLTRPDLRKYWLEDAPKILTDRLKNDIWVKAASILGEDLKIVNKDTQAMWDPIVRKGTPIMVIKIVTGTFVKNAEVYQEKLGSEDINGQYPLFDGLEYQCNDAKHQLTYMEV